MDEMHTGSCSASYRHTSARPDQTVHPARREPREYCVHDPAGRPIGTIAAPAVRPTLGTSAPTFYLRRDLSP